MCRTTTKNCLKFILASACMILLGTSQLFAKPKNGLVKEQSGYYYGYGKAATKEDAEYSAKKNLIERALSETLRTVDPTAQNIVVTDECVKARVMDLKPFAEQQSKNTFDIVYRVSEGEWKREEKAYADKLRKSLTPKYQAIASSTKTSDKIKNAIAILTVLSENGETELLTLQEKGTELFSRKVEALCSEIIQTLKFSVSEREGYVTSGTKFVVTVTDKAGKPIQDLPIKGVWELPILSVGSEESDAEVAEVVFAVETDATGKAVIDFPLDEAYQKKAVTLTVSTAFSTSKVDSPVMKQLDFSSAVECRYIHCESIEDAYPSVNIAAGSFTAGAVAQDTRALPSKEVTRTVKLPAFNMCLAPVTNAQYSYYLFVTRAEEEPEYFGNSDYNQPQQPVVGLTLADVENYAKWLSSQTGSKYRLPTDEEWEKAARAGTDNIYPWGDDDPSKSKKANYKGNGKFKKPSAVGSFPDSTNAWGLIDMAGNVWEWTSSTRNTKDTEIRTVKGGSWMDGPIELRISNFKNIDKSNGYPDVGFRLVKEASK